MKKLILKEILLLSIHEKKAKRIIFHPQRTVIIGRNSTGKSCLLKSIYRTFGAEPHKLHSDWKSANPISLVYFDIGQDSYSILRAGNKQFGIYNSKDEILEQFDSVSSLGAYLANIFQFKVLLPNKQGEIVIPPPAYLFLPYYIDQDNSWTHNWASFTQLYLPNTRKSIADYHTGIRPNKYYETKGEIRIIDDEIQKIDKESETIRKLLKTLKEKLSSISFSLSIEDFKDQLKELLLSCEELNIKQNEIKHKLSILYNQKINIEVQESLAKTALSETNKDYEFAVRNLKEKVECPVCGAGYDNSFYERFEIAQDEQRCLDLILELKAELKTINKKIELITSEFNSNNKTIADIHKILEHTQQQIQFKDIIENEGRKVMQKMFESEINRYEEELKDKYFNRESLRKEIKDLENKKRISFIKEEYRSHMTSFLRKVNVFSLKEISYKNIDSFINESGSALPRSLMAYYYSILHVIKNNGTSTYCPIVIDSPNQQGLDKENLALLLDFIVTNQPEDSQLILSIEETHGFKFDGDIIELTGNRSLLDSNEYDEVLEIVRPYLSPFII